MRPTLASLAVLAALALSSCGTTRIDAGKSERFIRSVVSGQVGARVASVTCPENVDVEKGATFTCAVRGTDGSKGSVEVTQKDDDGNVQVDAPFLHVREAEAVMAKELGRQVDEASLTIACPEIIVVRKDRRFECTATAAGKSREVAARLIDDAGQFSYRLT